MNQIWTNTEMQHKKKNKMNVKQILKPGNEIYGWR